MSRIQRLLKLAAAVALVLVLLQGAVLMIWLGTAALKDGENLATVANRVLMRALPASFYERNQDVVWHVEGMHEDQPKQVWAFANRHSVVAGERISVMASTRSGAITGEFRVVRVVGPTPAQGERQVVWQAPGIPVDVQEVRASAASLGVAWPAVVDIEVGQDWKSGFYSVDFVPDDGSPADLDVAYFVVAPVGEGGEVLVKLSTNTYQSYTQFGGHSLYRSDFLAADNGQARGGQMVSFDRPSRADYYYWEYYYAQWIDQIAAERGGRCITSRTLIYTPIQV